MAKLARSRVIAKQHLADLDLPAQVTLSLADLARAAKEHLLTLSVALGLATLRELFADEITRLVGPPGKRQPRRVSPRGEPARIRLKRAAHPSRGSRSRRRWSRPSSRPTRSNRWATASAWSSAT